MIPVQHNNRYFYHFTHIENLGSIIENGLISTNEKKRRKITHVNVANEEIQERRSNSNVPCHPYGSIHDYVPFYFAVRNPMLLSVLNRKNIDQPLVIFIAVSVNKLMEHNVVFTDAAANTELLPNFYSDPKNLDKLNWKLIDSKSWGSGTKGETQARMAEVLVLNNVPLEWIDSFIVFNELCKEKILKLFKDNDLKPPKISYSPFFYYTKFFFKDRKLFKHRKDETLITGPQFLKAHFEHITKNIIKKRSAEEASNPSFLNVKDAIEKIKSNFSIIPELDGIHQLETDNKVHSNKVCEHTSEVVENLDTVSFYKDLNSVDQLIVKLAAYFHDIGKGPHSKWKNGIQKAYADHPADSLKMMERILIDEFRKLSDYEIRKICLIVAYHDLIGDILGPEQGRSKKELVDLGVDKNELFMLIAISLADIKSIDTNWFFNVKMKLPRFIKDISREIGQY
ncbi:DarT ssDNA thymidine ADP-ribosyltransferase family protein [Brevibacillus sp. Leaf182]|uniref:type II toxin-antitoxin system toxin DNA ADP-ribosyl transferase DarT n=1 Tax=Brevibacillus sp. Leaf182 TaxID=1736290 RepID=UPI0006F98695|nr:DarT ssDNA thymidine ADP-ribosyltransferase family protein [Brevibacillus sp. Leaf182]RAT96979.1 DUF4433 domain-containing protein [Brevibacillus sp. Leaf182]